ncbi:hypothetical protein R3W88_033123 [Solanum pinnatisectum]|uniref:Ubiquitin-like protease family profile domain-containing protein n=1 Tax=Solanum pinnatisectum TaxID=50273 RepID=A0AAV9K2F5_9SOLN|nr:hypothetical protein R3W88_033123 [Solanum pinnatisectum]
MIPLFLVCTDYYGIRKEIDWITDLHYARKPLGEPLAYVNRGNVPQQADNSIDCGLYTCAFAEYVCRGDTNILISKFDSTNLRVRYGAFVWE